MFFDLCVSNELPLQLKKEIISHLIKLGYEGVAWNHVVTGRWNVPAVYINCFFSNQKNAADKAIPDVPISKEDLESLPRGLILTSQKKEFKQYKRLTIVVEDHSQTNTITPSNPLLQGYDILAVQPANEKLFHSCCTTLEVDIVSFDLSRKFDFHLKRPPVTSAIDRGVHFELSFAPALRDSSARKFLVSNAVNLMRATKGKNVILTSDAKKIMELRGPFDVINLGVLFGLTFDVSKTLVSTRSISVVLHGETRKSMKGVFSVTPILETQSDTKENNSNKSEKEEIEPMIIDEKKKAEEKPKKEQNKPNTSKPISNSNKSQSNQNKESQKGKRKR